MKVAEHAKRIMIEQKEKLIYYGNPQICHDIADAAGVKAKHPINVIATVMSCIGRSKLFERAGYIRHLNTNYPVYKIKN